MVVLLDTLFFKVIVTQHKGIRESKLINFDKWMNDTAILNTRRHLMWYYLFILILKSGMDEFAVYFVVLRWDQSAYSSL
jgi:hypothetical protein